MTQRHRHPDAKFFGAGGNIAVQADWRVFVDRPNLNFEWIPSIDPKRLNDRLLRREARGEMLIRLVLMPAVLELSWKEQLPVEPFGALKSRPQTTGLDQIKPDQRCWYACHSAVAADPADPLSAKPTVCLTVSEFPTSLSENPTRW